MKRKRAMACLKTVLVASLLSLVFPMLTEAAWMGPGCWVCDALGLTGVEERCESVGNDQHGDGTDCNEREDAAVGWFCYTNNTPCYNTVVNGGGGGGGGGTCTIGSFSLCPAECSSCTRDPFAF